SKYESANGSREKAHTESGERRQRACERAEFRKEQPRKHERGGCPVDKEVVPLNGSTDETCEGNLADRCRSGDNLGVGLRNARTVDAHHDTGASRRAIGPTLPSMSALATNPTCASTAVSRLWLFVCHAQCAVRDSGATIRLFVPIRNVAQSSWLLTGA